MMSEERARLFHEAYSQHVAIVWKTAHAFAVSKEDRDDLFQEILISLWEALPNFESRAKLSTYVYRIAHRRALNWKRSQWRYENKLARYEQDFPGLGAAHSDPSAQARLDWLYRAINDLRPVDRTICLLYLDGVSYREMAEIVGLTEDNIGIRVHRCKQQLANQLTHTDEKS
jgi:RNA polymerase sigma-70 factor (ECF subfamily)